MKVSYISPWVIVGLVYYVALYNFTIHVDMRYSLVIYKENLNVELSLRDEFK